MSTTQQQQKGALPALPDISTSIAPSSGVIKFGPPSAPASSSYSSFSGSDSTPATTTTTTTSVIYTQPLDVKPLDVKPLDKPADTTYKSADIQSGGDFDFKDNFDDTYKPVKAPLPDLSLSQKEWEGKSAHIMHWKKMDEAARLAAQTGAKHLQGVPVSDAVNKVEHKCNTSSSGDKDCTFFDQQLSAEHAITERDVLAIRQHDLVASQAAAAAGMLQKAGWIQKEVGVEVATKIVNKEKSSGPSVMKKIGTQIRGATSAIGTSFITAKDAVVSAKDDFVEGVSKKDDNSSFNKELKDVDLSSKSTISSTTTTKTSDTTPAVSTGPSRMARVGEMAISAKDTIYEAGVKATPLLQKAASVAGAVLSVAGAIAQPIVHHLAQGVAEVSAPRKQSDSLPEEIAANVADASAPLKKDLKDLKASAKDVVSTDKDVVRTDKDTQLHVEQTGSFRTKPFEPAQPLTAGQFMATEVKSRPTSPTLLQESTFSNIPSTSTTNTLGDVPAPLAARSQQYYDKTQQYQPGQTGTFDKNLEFDKTKYNQQLPADKQFKDTTTTTTTNVDYDLQSKQKNNLNLTQNQQRQQAL